MTTGTQLPRLSLRQLHLCSNTFRNRDIQLNRSTVLLGPGNRDRAMPGLEGGPRPTDAAAGLRRN